MSVKIPEFTPSEIDEGFAPEDSETKELYDEVAAFARQGQPILIFGPTGAGKEFLARHYYNTYIKTEFYGQLKDNWPLKFQEIIGQYSKFYSEKELEIFKRSVRPGVFQSINSATIYPTLAESILFGHEANAFNDAQTRPGLLESIKHGVLFMDEIGDLPKDLQAKMLRAVDSEICEGQRLQGKMNYSLKDLLIISATNRSRKKIRDDFYYKIGIEVEIKGIDERPKDVRKAIPFFIAKAIGKRKDYAAVSRMFGLTINDIKYISKLAEVREVKDFALELGALIAGEILTRRWPGNFRALRRAIESSVMRIESPENPESFAEKFRRNMKYYVTKYSDDTTKTAVVIEESYRDMIFPSSFPGLDIKINEELCKIRSLQYMSEYEKKALAVFLSSYNEKGFTRKELGEYYRNNTSIRQTSEANIRIKINRLQDLRILRTEGKGKSTRYHLTRSFLDLVTLKFEDIFSLPEVKSKWIGRDDEIDELNGKLPATDRIYIKAPPQNGKTAFIALYCNAMKSKFNLYYYPLGEEGLKKLFKDLLRLLRSKKIAVNSRKIMRDPVAGIKPYLSRIFKPKGGNRPVFILDNVNYIADPGDVTCMAEISAGWKELILILSGDKMDNILEVQFTEFQLMPWGRGA